MAAFEQVGGYHPGFYDWGDEDIHFGRGLLRVGAAIYTGDLVERFSNPVVHDEMTGANNGAKDRTDEMRRERARLQTEVPPYTAFNWTLASKEPVEDRVDVIRVFWE